MPKQGIRYHSLLLAKLCKSGLVFLDAQVQRRVPFFTKSVLLASQSRRVGKIIRHGREERRLRPGDIRTPLEIKQFQPRLVDDIPTSPSGKYEAVVHDASHGSLP